jgi:fido (protein-threonine AMPylation protein)
LRRHQGPYQAAIVPPIAGRRLTLPSAVLAAVDDASTEIARFDAELGTEIAPFAAILLRSESAASSQIENLTASARAIAEAEIGASSRHNATQIVANSRAMEAAVLLADRLDADAILAMHRALMEATEPDIAGRWRDQPVWIGGGNLGPHGATLVPPHHSGIRPAIDDLVTFLQRNDLPVLVQAAIAHAQFETIHPFPDGNGRTGRALLHARLRHKALTRGNTVPISAGLLTDTRAYFDALGAYRAGDPTAMVHQLTTAAFAAMANGRQLVADLRAIRGTWNSRISARSDSAVWRVADLLIRRPVISATVVTQELGIAATNVYRPIGLLVTAGILVEFSDQRRNRIWRSTEVLAALDAFATRAGRRRTPG